MKKYLPYLLFLLVCTVIYLFLKKPGERSMRRTPADATVEAPTLFNEFYNDEAAANENYLNKVVKLTGKVKTSSKDKDGLPELELESGSPLGTIRCAFDPRSDHRRRPFEQGEAVQLKCICTDFYRDVKLVRCVEM